MGYEKISVYTVIDTVRKKIWIGAFSFQIKQLTMNEAQHTNRRDRAQTEPTEVMRQNKERKKEMWS